MKLKILSSFLLVLGIALSSCSPGATATASLEPPTVQDEPSLLKVLQSAGATVETGDSIKASKVAPDGGSVGTSMMMWIDTPHFYKAGRIIVLYLGKDKSLLDLLNKVMGPQFAGQ